MNRRAAIENFAKTSMIKEAEASFRIDEKGISTHSSLETQPSGSAAQSTAPKRNRISRKEMIEVLIDQGMSIFDVGAVFDSKENFRAVMKDIEEKAQNEAVGDILAKMKRAGFVPARAEHQNKIRS